MSLINFPNSGNTYYFRSRIPNDLMEHFGGMKEFRLSLKCAIKTHANKTTKILERKVLRLYESIRQGMKSLDIEDIKEILRVEIRKQILHAHHVYEGTNRWSESGVSQSLDSVQLKESNLKEKLESSFRSYQGEIDSKLEEILTSLDIEVDKKSVDFKKLRNKFIDLYLLRHEWMKELVNKTGKSDNDFRRDAQTKLDLELFPELSNPSVSHQSDIKTISPSEPIKTSISPLLSDASEQSLSSSSATYFERKKIGGVILKSIETDKSIVNEFIEITGDIDFSMLTKKMVSHYIDVQTKLPPNRTKTPKYRDLSIQEIVLLN